MTDSKGTANGPAHRKHDDGSGGRAFTVEQKAAVIRVRKCKATDFYDILGLEEVRKTCSDGDIKKAYRKLSLLTHPDKNGYQGADEAFKLVSRAFQILSDPDKKSRYDQFGGDPDNRFSSASASGASPFSGFASRRGAGGGARGPMFEDEISPEEMFRQFFGGGGMGGPFGGMGGGFGGGFGGPGFIFNMGGPGIRIHQFGGDRPRRRPHNHENQPNEPASMWRVIQGILPLLILFVLPVLSSLFSGSGSPGPSLRFDSAVPPHTMQRTTSQLKIPYFINPRDVEDYTNKHWRDLDKVAESKYIEQLSKECEWEQSERQREIWESHGLFFTDHDRIKRVRAKVLQSCQKLNSHGYKIR